ncbi:MAG: hypothetical protein A3K54_00090 [Omnitrophica WOR_2 bacterium RBG_13_44_8]|nr:MAG: hypothetical protein A3K54_00090 [Omnitrophica WOR_2 bacterium RBG_13_44_8]
MATQILNIEKAHLVRKYEKVQRNDPCPCGSGKKYKNCCIRADIKYMTIKPAEGKTNNKF